MYIYTYTYTYIVYMVYTISYYSCSCTHTTIMPYIVQDTLVISHLLSEAAFRQVGAMKVRHDQASPC